MSSFTALSQIEHKNEQQDDTLRHLNEIYSLVNNPLTVSIALDSDRPYKDEAFRQFFRQFLRDVRRSNLRQVRITWRFLDTVRACIPREGRHQLMARLGEIQTLEQVELGGDLPGDWRHQWNSIEIDSITTLLQGTRNLRKLRIDKNGICIARNLADVQDFASALVNKTRLEELTLENVRVPLECRKTHIFDPLFHAVALHPSLKVLHLCVTLRQRPYFIVPGLSEHALRNFCQMSQVSTLVLGNIGLNDTHASVLFETLQYNNYIRELHLSGNRVMKSRGLHFLLQLVRTIPEIRITATNCGDEQGSANIAIHTHLQQADSTKGWAVYLSQLTATPCHQGGYDIMSSAVYQSIRDNPLFWKGMLAGYI